MILPRYSIRTVLYLAIVVAVVSLVAGQAVQGVQWAAAVTIAVGSLGMCWLVYIVFYGMTALFARVALRRQLQQASGAYYPALRREDEPPTGEPETSHET